MSSDGEQQRDSSGPGAKGRDRRHEPGAATRPGSPEQAQTTKAASGRSTAARRPPVRAMVAARDRFKAFRGAAVHRRVSRWTARERQ